MQYYVYKLLNPEDFKGLSSAEIRPLDPYGRSELYVGEFLPSHFSDRGFSRSVPYLKMCIRREWRDTMHRGKKMKWKKYLWHKDGLIDISAR